MLRLLHLLCFSMIALNLGCTEGSLDDPCSGDDDCADHLTCVGCSGGGVCHYDSDHSYVCASSGLGTPTGSGGGGSSNSSNGSCATYNHSVNWVQCDPYSCASKCKGKFMGVGSSCAGFTCTDRTLTSTCSVPGSSGSGGSAGGNCDNAWTCAYDSQASPMCQWACTLSGSERSQTCQVLESMLTSGNTAECCPIICP